MKIDNRKFRKLLGVVPEKAIQLLYENCYYQLLKISLNSTQCQEASEDIVQEVFALVWENHKKLAQDHDVHIQFYLIKIVKFKSISYFRQKELRRKKLEQQADFLKKFTASPELDYMRFEQELNIRKLILTFPRRERQTLLLKIDGWAVTEIAAMLNVSIKAVQKSITSGKKRLTGMLAALKF